MRFTPLHERYSTEAPPERKTQNIGDFTALSTHNGACFAPQMQPDAAKSYWIGAVLPESDDETLFHNAPLVAVISPRRRGTHKQNVEDAEQRVHQVKGRRRDQ